MTTTEAADIWKLQGDWKVRLYHPYIKESWIESLNKMLTSTPLSNFGIRQQFESQLASYCGSNYAVAVNSGTSALLIGMLALGLKRGDSIIGPNYGNIAWANVCRFIGINVITLDVREDNFCLDENLLNEYLINNPGTVQAVCYINQAGYTGPQVELTSHICKAHNVILIEDSCNAMGQWYEDKHAGTTGDMGFISFGVPKLITCGEGGAILIKDKATYDLCNDMAYQGGWYSAPMHTRLGLGLNVVMPAHNAYFLSKQLEDIEELLYMRNEVCDMYIEEGVDTKRFHQAPSIYEYYAKNPLKVVTKGVGFKTQFLHRSYTEFGHLFDCSIETPIARDLEKSILTLPASLNLDRQSIKMVAASIMLGER